MASKPDPVDALLKAGPRRTHLPEPAERARLRTAYGLTQTEIAGALDVTRTTVAGWEAGRSEPQGTTRAAYAKLLEGIATQLAAAPAPRTEAVEAEPQTTAAPAPGPAAPAPAAPVPAPVAPSAPEPPVASEPSVEASVATPAAPPPLRKTPAATRRPPVRNSAAREPAPTAAAVDPRFANGPLAVLDGDGSAYCVGGLVLDCPATTVPALVEWTLTEARLGAPRLNRNGRDADPLVVITAAAAERLGLPEGLEDRRGLRLPEDHKVNKQIARAKWKTTRRGFGPWARVYRPAQGGSRQCVQFAIVPWGALDARAWGDAAHLPAAELAQVLGTYATRVITPRGSCAVSGLELMTALRPPTRAVKDATTGAWSSGPNPGSLTAPVDPAPPEAPDEHPVVAALYPRGHRRTPAEVLDEEAYEWIRDPELLTDEECTKPYAVGIDVNMAFAAAANRLNVGLGPAVHINNPEFDPKLPGSWLVDLSHIEIDPRLPNPFTPHGVRPSGPAWYATPTVAYAVELGHQVRPAEAYVRREHAAYLDAWYTRLRDAYMITMAELGVVSSMDEADFLKAMDQHKQVDAGQAAVLSAIKSTVKGGIGKLRERPQGLGYRPGERWPALERPTWRPDIRAAVISAARINMHRKMLKIATVGLFPIAVLSDCAVYLSDGPSPLDFLPRTPDDKPLPGGFRLGVSPGMVKCEGSQPMMWAVHMLDQGHNPARHIKGSDASADGE
ncbi:transcriptional regulator [Streptomyces agglomeratus]|uniref:Transcriptional regulator n=1 Tax=Streptomyces agglomeratus TaxID=285458 RepID=A0A1E5P2Q2_9ACTN|nr:helix-turn-helix transcriptional regulator [Streptomyces agglomeratus]OEJ23767.1 transcriptional regulator [Streptomyces agglomeratus]OEJ43362.1 transcriptional regulator [Streptomyces agglomeratus]OEJ54719.1 transcriptional regulator [Streptomyces agglomeratus]